MRAAAVIEKNIRDKTSSVKKEFSASWNELNAEQKKKLLLTYAGEIETEMGLASVNVLFRELDEEPLENIFTQNGLYT